MELQGSGEGLDVEFGENDGRNVLKLGLQIEMIFLPLSARFQLPTSSRSVKVSNWRRLGDVAATDGHDGLSDTGSYGGFEKARLGGLSARSVRVS